MKRTSYAYVHTPPAVGRLLVIVAAMTSLLAGCATHLSRPLAPNTKLQDYQSFYIVHNQTDQRGISKVIAAELALHGKAATSGPESTIPNGIDAVITYHEDWKWDIRWYLLNLLIQFRDPKTNVLLTSAASYRTSLARAEPELMTREVLEAIFK